MQECIYIYIYKNKRGTGCTIRNGGGDACASFPLCVARWRRLEMAELQRLGAGPEFRLTQMQLEQHLQGCLEAMMGLKRKEQVRERMQMEVIIEVHTGTFAAMLLWCTSFMWRLKRARRFGHLRILGKNAFDPVHEGLFRCN